MVFGIFVIIQLFHASEIQWIVLSLNDTSIFIEIINSHTFIVDHRHWSIVHLVTFEIIPSFWTVPFCGNVFKGHVRLPWLTHAVWIMDTRHVRANVSAAIAVADISHVWVLIGEGFSTNTVFKFHEVTMEMVPHVEDKIFLITKQFSSSLIDRQLIHNMISPQCNIVSNIKAIINSSFNDLVFKLRRTPCCIRFMQGNASLCNVTKQSFHIFFCFSNALFIKSMIQWFNLHWSNSKMVKILWPHVVRVVVHHLVNGFSNLHRHLNVNFVLI